MEAAERWVAQIERDVNDQIIARNQELEHEKQALIDEIDALRKDNDELRKQLLRQAEEKKND